MFFEVQVASFCTCCQVNEYEEVDVAWQFIMLFFFCNVFFSSPNYYSPKFLEMPEKGSSGNKVTFVQ